MDPNPTPFPVKKFQPVKSKYNRKISEPPSKTNARDPTIQRQKRVFGTTRNPNLPTKPAIEKPITTGVPQKQPNSTQSNQLSADFAATPVTELLKKSPDENRVKPKKKSVCFIENVAKNSSKGKIAEPKTPVKSPSLVKPGVWGTPYHTAERCSNCRFDRLETSSYWLSQIKLAESVGKHFVSAAFFQLALESQAEPIRYVGVELKRYLARHAYLCGETEWVNASRSYGLLEDVDSGSGKASASDAATEHEELKKEAIEDPNP